MTAPTSKEPTRGVGEGSDANAHDRRSADAGAHIPHSPDEFRPPFIRKTLGKKLIWWANDLLIAYDFCQAHGLRLVKTDAEYQVAKIIGDDVKLVVYPHTTSGTGNKHLRVRDEHSKNKPRAVALMALLERAAGPNCTFRAKWTTNSLPGWSTPLADLERLAARTEGGSASPQTSSPASDRNPS